MLLMHPGRTRAAPAFALASALGAAASPCAAAGAFGGSLALTSDYVYRGLSQTCGKPAAQADLHYRLSSGESAAENFIGVWGSVDLSGEECRAKSELNAYAGRTWLLPSSDSSATLTYVHYTYPSGNRPRYDYDELEGAWAYQDRVFITLAWSPNTLRYTDESISYDRSALACGLQLHQPLGTAFTVSAGVGYDQFADPSGTGYGFWNAGIAYALGSAQFDVSYFDTASRATRLYGEYVAGARWSATLVWRF